MIEATRLNGSTVVVNSDLIEMVESTPDTLISLTTGRKIMVRESIDEIVRRTVEYRSKVRTISVPTGAREQDGPASAEVPPLRPR
jgi:flagellar protein FlbD